MTTSRIALLFTLACLAAGAAAAPAGAIPPTCDDPIDCPPEESPRSSTLTVVKPAQGMVSGGGISCGTICSKAFAWTETCFGTGPMRECFESEVDDPQLVASGGRSGYSPSWSGCTSVAAQTCTVHMNANRTVSVTWRDTTAPTIALLGPPATAGPATVFSASAVDNSGTVAKVDFYVDDVLRGTDTGAPFTFSPSLGLYADGTSHALEAVAQDAAGLRSGAASHTFEVDKSTGLSGVSTPAAHATSAPTVAFSIPADAEVECRTRLGSDVKGTTAPCAAPYTAQLGAAPTDGRYTIELAVEDAVGNTATVTRTFTLDRGAPNLTVGSPGPDAIIGVPFTPAVTVADGFTPDGQNAVSCRIDAGGYGPCAALAPADGAHTLTVRAADIAGNATSATVGFTYDATAPAVAITAGPAEGSVVYARSASFAFAASDLTAVATSCRLDDGGFSPCAGALALADLSHGIHTVVIRAEDAAGNVAELQRRFTVSDLPVVAGAGGAAGAGSGGGGAVEPARIDARVSTFWKLMGKRTRIKKLTVRGAPRGGTVTVRCRSKAKGCAFKRIVVRVKRSKIALAKRFERRKLRPKAVIGIVIAKDGMVSERYRYKTRARKFPKLKQR